MSFTLWAYNENGVDWKEIQLDISNDVDLNLAIEDFTFKDSTDRILSYFTYELNASDTDDFRASFGMMGSPCVINQYRGQKVNAQLVADYKELNGELIFLGETVSNGCRTFRLQFIAGYRNFSNALVDCQLCDLDFGKTLYSQGVIELARNDIDPYSDNPVWWGLKYYGDDYENSDFFDIHCHKPDIYYKAIIDKLAEKAGIQIFSKFFDSEYFRRLVALFPVVLGLSPINATG